jgi:hypothetical protein
MIGVVAIKIRLYNYAGEVNKKKKSQLNKNLPHIKLIVYRVFEFKPE